MLFIDVGGSMDEHTQICEEVFSAANSEFKSLDFFNFSYSFDEENQLSKSFEHFLQNNLNLIMFII